jgi:hypothetical protein
VSARSLNRERDVIREVSVRTRDDLAVLQDLPRGKNQISHAFPVLPTFDALAYFELSWKVGAHTEVTAYVHDIKPLTYTDRGPNKDVDVVVSRLRDYKAEYAPDSSDAPNGKTHLTFAPFQFVRDRNNADTTFYFSDVYIDNATDLPTRVRFAGANDMEFVVDYGHVDGHWVVTHAHYEETLHGPLRVGRLHVSADAVYDNFTFPAAAPDPRLAG